MLRIKRDNRKQSSVFESAALVAVMVLFFKLIGFVKQAVVAYCFGASLETDIYNIAYGFIVGASESLVKALSVAMIGAYTQVRIQEGRSQAQTLVSKMLELSLLFAGVCVVLICLFAPQLARMLAPRYSAGDSGTLAIYIIMLSGAAVFTVLELVGTAVLESEQQYFVSRVQSLIYSLCVMLACVFFAGTTGVKALIIAFYLSAIINSIIIWRAAGRFAPFRLVKPTFDPYVKKVFRLAIPLLIGNSAIQINQIVDKTITSGLAVGSVSALSYCHVLTQFVTNILIVNVGNVLFAHFTNLVVEGKQEHIQAELAKSLRLLVCVLIPITVITLTNAKEIVEIVYYRGEFSSDAVRLTSAALIGYTVSFPLVGIRDLLTKSMYAYQDTRRPMVVSLISIACNIVFSILLSRRYGILGVALGASLAIGVGMVLNVLAFRKDCRGFSYHSLLVTLLKSVPAALLCAGSILAFKRYIPSFGSFGTFCGSTALGLLLFVTVLLAEKESTMRDLLTKVIKTYRRGA